MFGPQHNRERKETTGKVAVVLLIMTLSTRFLCDYLAVNWWLSNQPITEGQCDKTTLQLIHIYETIVSEFVLYHYIIMFRILQNEVSTCVAMFPTGIHSGDRAR